MYLKSMETHRSQNVEKHYFSEWGLPGVEMIPRPRGSILHPSRASQLPYSAKSKFSEFSYNFPIYIYIYIYIFKTS